MKKQMTVSVLVQLQNINMNENGNKTIGTTPLKI